MTSAARGRESLQGEQRHGRRPARKRLDLSALLKEVFVLFDGVRAGGFDQETRNRNDFGVRERIEILAETRSIAIKDKGVGKRRESFVELGDARRTFPILTEGVVVRRGKCRRQQANQEFTRGGVEVRASPREGDDGVVLEIRRDFRWADAAYRAAATADGKPRGGEEGKVEHGLKHQLQQVLTTRTILSKVAWVQGDDIAPNPGYQGKGVHHMVIPFCCAALLRSAVEIRPEQQDCKPGRFAVRLFSYLRFAGVSTGVYTAHSAKITFSILPPALPPSRLDDGDLEIPAEAGNARYLASAKITVHALS